MKISTKDTLYETSFPVMPKDCNYLKDMICGGNLLYEMDIAAAMSVRRAMYKCEDPGLMALTVGVNDVRFLIGAIIGDMIHIRASVVKTGLKSITVKVVGHRELHGTGDLEKICSGEFTFCAVDKNRKGIRHGLTMD